VSRRCLALVGRLALVAVLTAGCTGSQPTAPPPPLVLTIGVLAPASGPNLAAGRQALQGAQLAVELVNNVYPDLPLPLASSAGLRDGAQLQLASADTGTGAAGASGRTGQLISQNRAVALIVADSAEVVSAASTQAEQAQVPLLDALTSVDSLIDQNRDWYFRTSPDDRILAQNAFGLLSQVQNGGQPVRRVVLLDGSGPADAATVGTLKDLLSNGGFDRFASFQINPAGGAPVDLPAKVANEHPDVMFTVVSNPSDANAAAALVAQGGNVPLIALGHGMAAFGGSVKVPGVLRVVGWSTALAQRNPITRAVAEMYQLRFGSPMSDVAASTFTAALSLAASIDAADGTTTTQIRAALRQLWLPATATIMPWNGVRFDSNGQNTLANGLIEQQAGTGFKIVYPRELAEAVLAWK
jgi:branched-chain amino acid transport system substrate-binding protein